MDSVAMIHEAIVDNAEGRPGLAQTKYRQAFEATPDLAALILPPDHPHHGYKFEDLPEREITACPLCGAECDLKWVYPALTNFDFNPNFSPLKVWRYCGDCNHYFSAFLPMDLKAAVIGHTDEQYMNVKFPRLIEYGDMLGRLILNGVPPHKNFSILDVGCGGGELLAVALEHGMDVTGIDIRPDYAERTEAALGCHVDSMPFEDYPSGEFTFVHLGDVLEHFEDPVAAIKKAHGFSSRLIISTPNADSAFDRLFQHDDPMRRVCEHVNYFTFDSLKALLKTIGREPLSYRVSRHFNGCMEVTA